jgi:muconolactone D-isomerase
MRTQQDSADAGHLEFLVELRTVIPEGIEEAEETVVRRGEAIRMAQLAAAGHVLRLWRISDQHGEFTTGLWRATDETELRGLLLTLPLSPWMGVVIRRLREHPNDPRRAVAPTSP